MVDKLLIKVLNKTERDNMVVIVNDISTEIKRTLLRLHFPHEKTFSTIALNNRTEADNILGSFRPNNKILNLNNQNIHDGTLIHEAFHLLDSHIANYFGFESNLMTEILLNNPKIINQLDIYLKNKPSKEEKNFISILNNIVNQKDNSLYYLPSSTTLSEKLDNLQIYSKKYLNININMDIKETIKTIHQHINTNKKINPEEQNHLSKMFNDYLNNQSNRNLFSIFAEIYDFTRAKGPQKYFNIINKKNIYYRQPTELLARIFQSKVDKNHLDNIENTKLYPLGTEKIYLQSLAKKITNEYSMINGHENTQKYKSSDISVKNPLEKILKMRQKNQNRLQKLN